MEFTESQARKLQREFNIPDSTLRVWRYRMVIPNKYKSDENKTPVETYYSCGSRQLDNIIHALSFNILNRNAFGRLVGIKKKNVLWLDEVLSKEELPTKDQLFILQLHFGSLHLEINWLRKTLRRKGVIPEKDLAEWKKIFSKKEYNWEVILQRKKGVLKKLNDWKEGKQADFPYKERKGIISCLEAIWNETYWEEDDWGEEIEE